MDTKKLDQIVNQARKYAEERNKGYREQSLRIHPWICARCGREFTRKNLHELTVHHKDHNHDNNPVDGSNWENLCLYCHDQEHLRYEEQKNGHIHDDDLPTNTATYQPFSNLSELLKSKK